MRYGRHIPAHLRTALELGKPPRFDGPECSGQHCHHRFVQWDHDNPVANGGATSGENLNPLCPLDHRDKTEQDRRAGLLNGKGKQGEGRDPP